MRDIVENKMYKNEYQIRSEQIRRGIKAKKDRQMKLITSTNPIVVARVSKIIRN